MMTKKYRFVKHNQSQTCIFEFDIFCIFFLERVGIPVFFEISKNAVKLLKSDDSIKINLGRGYFQPVVLQRLCLRYKG